MNGYNRRWHSSTGLEHTQRAYLTLHGDNKQWKSSIACCMSPGGLCAHHCHLLAALGAAAAELCTFLHRTITTNLLTILGAAAAGLNAESAGPEMKEGVAQHGVFGDEAHLAAIHQRLNQVVVYVLSTFMEAVCNRLHTDSMAVFAVLNALLHRQLLHRHLLHTWLLHARLRH